MELFDLVRLRIDPSHTLLTPWDIRRRIRIRRVKDCGRRVVEVLTRVRRLRGRGLRGIRSRNLRRLRGRGLWMGKWIVVQVDEVVSGRLVLGREFVTGLRRGELEALAGRNRETSVWIMSREDCSDLQNLLRLFLGCFGIASARSVRRHRKDIQEAYIFALMIQSRSSSPSSDPPRPPRTRRKSRGCQSTPSSARLAASSRCISSMRDFSVVAASWSFVLRAWVTFSHNFCDSRSSCSLRGLTLGGVSFARLASKSSSFLPVC